MSGNSKGWDEIVGAVKGALSQNGVQIAERMEGGADRLELGRDVACKVAGFGRRASAVLAVAGVLGKRGARKVERACASIEVAGQIAAVGADGAREAADIARTKVRR